jgi:hypothetical protein
LFAAALTGIVVGMLVEQHRSHSLALSPEAKQRVSGEGD